MDFDDIYLSKQELKVLEQLETEVMERNQIDNGVFRHLKSLNFILVTFSMDSPDVAKITEDGKGFLRFNEKRRKAFIRSRRDFWIPTTIAIISLGFSLWAKFW